MALPLARYPDKPLIEEAPRRTPTPAPQRFIAPGLSKTPRRIVSLPRVAQAARSTFPGVSGLAGSAIVAEVPASAVWRNPDLAVQGVCSAVVGTRIYVFELLDANDGEVLRTGEISATAGQSFLLRFDPVGSAGWTSLGPTAVKTAAPAPRYPLPGRWKFVLVDLSNIDAADTIVVFGGMEELTVPRGLAKDEVPMGLESGAMWEPRDVRKVAED